MLCVRAHEIAVVSVVDDQLRDHRHQKINVSAPLKKKASVALVAASGSSVCTRAQDHWQVRVQALDLQRDLVPIHVRHWIVHQDKINPAFRGTPPVPPVRRLP